MKIPKSFLILGFIVLTLNTAWEFSHYFLYVDSSGISKYPHLIIASFADMAIIMGIFTTVSLKKKNFSWARNAKKSDYLLTVFSGLTIAAFIEYINLNLGRWAYTSAMPTIFGIGISPLIQLALTGTVSLVILKFVEKR